MRIRYLAGIMLSIGFAFACKKEIVRDANVYRAEQDWNRAISMKLVESRLDYATKLAKNGNLPRCESEAKMGLLAKVRIPYHYKMSLYLAGMGVDPGEPPIVEDAGHWCRQQIIPIPDLGVPSDLGVSHDH